MKLKKDSWYGKAIGYTPGEATTYPETWCGIIGHILARLVFAVVLCGGAYVMTYGNWVLFDAIMNNAWKTTQPQLAGITFATDLTLMVVSVILVVMNAREIAAVLSKYCPKVEWE